MELSDSAKIKVISVGGGGGNALNEMIRQRLRGVEFIAVNTDKNALQHSRADQKIHIGERLTKGMGTGSSPRKGRQAALEDIEKLKDAVSGADMVVIVACMGGGTGTGAAPVIAQVAKEIGVLTVGVVSLPFSFEGKKRSQNAKAGIGNMLTHSNSVVAISCEEFVQDPAGEKTFLTMLMEVDTALYSAVRGITDLITVEGLIGIDFADVNAILRSQGGLCLMAEGKGSGALRAHDAAVAAIACWRRTGVPFETVRAVAMRISLPTDGGIDEVSEAAIIISEHMHEDAHIIFQAILDTTVGEALHITVIAADIEVVEDGGGTGNVAQRDTGRAYHEESDFIFGEEDDTYPA